ncbi:MAG: hypothetical protein ACREHG_07160 [Candidatus Saccharimonadales bacterium]
MDDLLTTLARIEIVGSEIAELVDKSPNEKVPWVRLYIEKAEGFFDVGVAIIRTKRSEDLEKSVWMCCCRKGGLFACSADLLGQTPIRAWDEHATSWLGFYPRRYHRRVLKSLPGNARAD